MVQTILKSVVTDGLPERQRNNVLVDIQGLGKDYGDTTVLNDINLSVNKGEVIAIIGPSGSGKSTLLRCVNLLDPPTRGTLRVGDTCIDASQVISSRQTLELRRPIGMVFQSFNLFPHLSVLRNVSIAQERVLKRDRKQADEVSRQLLDRVGLLNKADQYPSRCSGGQQQRIAIARALALEPSLMLFDEPTSALDPELGLEVLNVMQELATQGMTMIVVTHEMHFAESVSDRVLIMADGRVIEEGRSQQVMRKPQSERAQRFLSAVMNR
ncbi:L-cystine import ATP-binding protein TcyC [Pseudomonas reidholzensis]|uniref:L-cystine import ATP-binding protein TcyC n=1 Tax=Pseudomonas reidholzensis TaxID=1785162 RepID=A0A383RQQ5_9PSED|nr:amino acid ABC transporter ATP-binding protein [Pseudomonas reidholzensis]SYX88984.1 L-cystine import ATP-binding protein TcyC [Pseudomonas reidholzensis]